VQDHRRDRERAQCPRRLGIGGQRGVQGAASGAIDEAGFEDVDGPLRRQDVRGAAANPSVTTDVEAGC
jgi:hypothetical protein